MAVTVFPIPTPPASTAKSPTTVIINSTQSWSAPAGVNQIELFLVGGGGGGGGCDTGNHRGGGGGGGGVLSQTITVTPGTSYTVTIGAGGAAGTASSTSPGSNGSASTFGSLVTSYGGGGGISSAGIASTAGLIASGGGNGITTGNWSGAGGGAAISYPTNIGVNAIYFYANGNNAVVQGSLGYMHNAQIYFGNPGLNGYGAGGGPSNGSTVIGRGGLNAGQGATGLGAGTSGTANFGGGGGGSIFSGSYFSAGAGGSGTCIIRYWS